LNIDLIDLQAAQVICIYSTALNDTAAVSKGLKGVHRCEGAGRTDAGPHVHGGHESVVAEAAIFPGDVGALASVADVRTLLTLVDIYTARGGGVTDHAYTHKTEPTHEICLIAI